MAMLTEARQLVEKVATGNRILAKSGLADAIRISVGHVSARIPNTDLIILKGRGYPVDLLSKMTPDDMIIVDINTNSVVEGPPGITIPKEIPLHTAVFRQRADVMSVVHAHPEYTTLMSVMDKPLALLHHEGAEVVYDGVPNFQEFRVIDSDLLGDDMARAMGSKETLMLKGHGAVSSGRSVEEALVNMMGLEDQAKRNYMALACAGASISELSPDQVKEYVETRSLGASPPIAIAMWHYYEEQVRP